MIIAKIKDKLFQRYLRKVKTRLPVNCLKAVTNIAEHIDRKAMSNLTDNLGTGLTNERWGHSQDIPIRESKVITDISTPKEARVRLEYTSPHAWIVEFGGLGKVVTSKDKPFPIGKSNFGEPVAIRESFHLQVGYHFLENAIEDPTTKRYIEREITEAIKKSTRRWF